MLNLVVVLERLHCPTDDVRQEITEAGHLITVENVCRKTIEQDGKTLEILDCTSAVFTPLGSKSSHQVILALHGIKLRLHGRKFLLPHKGIELPTSIDLICQSDCGLLALPLDFLQAPVLLGYC